MLIRLDDGALQLLMLGSRHWHEPPPSLRRSRTAGGLAAATLFVRSLGLPPMCEPTNQVARQREGRTKSDAENEALVISETMIKEMEAQR